MFLGEVVPGSVMESGVLEELFGTDNWGDWGKKWGEVDEKVEMAERGMWDHNCVMYWCWCISIEL